MSFFWPHRHKRSGKSCRDPDQDADGHDEFPGVPITEVPEEWREEHVADHEGRLESSGLPVADVVLILDLPQDSWIQGTIIH